MPGLSTSPAAAQDSAAVLNQRLWVQVSAFRPEASSTLRVDDKSQGLQGSSIGLERDLGLPRHKTLPALLVGARFGERWRSEFEYFALDRKVDGYRIDRTYRVDDSTYNASALVNTEFDSTVFRLSAGYSVWRTPDAEFGVVVGAHVTRLAFAISGQTTVAGIPVALERESSRATVPLPTLGLYVTRALSSQWAVNARADYFSLTHGHYDGRLLNAQANVFYRINPNLGVGVGYRHDDYKVGVKRDDLSAQIDYRVRGPQIVIDAGF